MRRRPWRAPGERGGDRAAPLRELDALVEAPVNNTTGMKETM